MKPHSWKGAGPVKPRSGGAPGGGFPGLIGPEKFRLPHPGDLAGFSKKENRPGLGGAAAE